MMAWVRTLTTFVVATMAPNVCGLTPGGRTASGSENLVEEHFEAWNAARAHQSFLRKRHLWQINYTEGWFWYR
jgi:hypothetical protein